jgi:hypothetical protein
MRAFVLIAIAACIHRPALTADEQCASHDMVVQGISMSTAQGYGVATSGAHTAISAGSTYTETVSCREPATREERCEALAANASLAVKRDFGTTSRNIAIVAGYVAFILPGFMMYLLFHEQEEDVEADARERHEHVLGGCTGTVP